MNRFNYPSLVALIVAVTLMPQLLVAQQANRAAAPQQQDSIQLVAVVNGQSIDRDHLARQCAIRFGEGVLESMVNKMLIFNQLQKLGIVITEQDVNNEIQRQAERYGLSSQRYIEAIHQERNVSPDKFKNDIIWLELALRRLAASKIEVTPNEIAERMQFEYGPNVQVRAIASNTREDAEQILTYVQNNPEEFGKVAKDQSVDPQSAAVRGLIPPIRKNMGEEVLENAAFSLEAGQISEVIHAGEQFIILKCERHYPAAGLNPEQRAQAEEFVEKTIREEKLSGASAQLFRELQSTAEIVNVYNNEQLRQQHPNVAATVNGSPISLSRLYEECITRFGQDVLIAEIDRTIVMQELQRNSLSVTDQDIQNEIDQAASAFGFYRQDNTIDRDAWLEHITKGSKSKLDIYIQDDVWPSAALKKIVQNNVQVTQEDMTQGFASRYGERVECLAIVMKDQRLAHRVLQQAMADPNEKYFGELAHQYSSEPASRANYGQVPPIPQYSQSPVLEEEAFKLEAGEISGLVNVGEFWVILYCQGRTTPLVTDFDAVKDELHKAILEKKFRIAMTDELARLTQSAQVDNFMAGTSQPGASAVQSARNQQGYQNSNGQQQVPRQ